MKISIITTSFNTGLKAKEAMDSVLSQKCEAEVEYIFTAAGSQEGVEELRKLYGDKVNFVDATKTNQSEGINMGLQMATGDIVAFINDDDVYEEGAFQSVINAFEKEPQANWLIGRCKVIDGNSQEMFQPITVYKDLLLRFYSYWLLLLENMVSQPSVFWRRSVNEKFGYLDGSENLVMDYEFWLRIGYKNRPIILHKYLSRFRRMPSTKSNTRFKQQFKDDMRVAVKYMKKYSLHFLIPFKYLSYLKTILIYSFIIK
jgi:glycosyltransferase involved in cell wall biosynthesis